MASPKTSNIQLTFSVVIMMTLCASPQEWGWRDGYFSQNGRKLTFYALYHRGRKNAGLPPCISNIMVFYKQFLFKKQNVRMFESSARMYVMFFKKEISTEFWVATSLMSIFQIKQRWKIFTKDLILGKLILSFLLILRTRGSNHFMQQDFWNEHCKS